MKLSKIMSSIIVGAMFLSSAGCSRYKFYKPSLPANPNDASRIEESLSRGKTYLYETKLSKRPLDFDFDNAIQNIILFGNKISLPCTFKEFGEDFSIENPYVLPSLAEEVGFDILIYSLSYKGQRIGNVMFRNCLPDDPDIESKKIFHLKITRALTENKPEINFMGVTFDSTATDIIDSLGRVSRISEDGFAGGSNLYYNQFQYVVSDGTNDTKEVIVVTKREEILSISFTVIER